MSRKIIIDPVTRIEGHLSIETSVDGGMVVDARVSGRMYRGFENLLVGRHPVDAARITQRICGICHEVHGIAASIALEDLYGLKPTPNGLVIRELILGLHLVTDHLFHFYQLTLPDYLDFSLLKKYQGSDVRISRLNQLFNSSPGTFSHVKPFDAVDDMTLTAEMAIAYADAINVRKLAGSGLASLGGKVPFCHSILPGGVTTDITSAVLMNYANALDKTAEFVHRFYLPQAITLAKLFKPYFYKGQSHGSFYSNGGFELLDKPLYRPGVFHDNRQHDVSLAEINEVVDSSYLNDHNEIEMEKPGAYSWVKAIAYKDKFMEVGPLARLVVNRDQGFGQLLAPYKVKLDHSSVMTRILARAYEADLLCKYLLKIVDMYDLQGPTINSPDMLAKPSGVGQGMSIAARGALNHQVTAKDGLVTGYRLQVPSAWNFGPTVKEQRGVVEQALIGTALESAKGPGGRSDNAVEVGRIVRSFDPCLACAIH